MENFGQFGSIPNFSAFTPEQSKAFANFLNKQAPFIQAAADKNLKENPPTGLHWEGDNLVANPGYVMENPTGPLGGTPYARFVGTPNTSDNDLFGNIIGGVKDVASGLASTVKDVASSPVGQIGLAFALPGAGAALAAELGVSAAVGTALVSTAAQVANGVSFEDALKNATVNAVVQSGSPTIANDIAKTVGSPGVADAITSGGASIGATLAKGGTMDDALKNATAAIVASGASQATDSRAIGAAVGGGVTGGATGAALGAAGELGRPTATNDGVKVASAGNITSDPNVVSDSPPQDLGLTEIVGNKDTGIGSTDVQVLDQIRRQNEAAPNAVPAAPAAPVTQPAATPVTTKLPEVEVTASKPTPTIADTDTQILDTIRNQQQPQQIPEVVVTAQRPPATIADTNIQPVTELPKVEVTDKKETPTIANTDIQVEDTEKPIDKTVEEPAPYKPDLFFYSGKKPSTLSKSLGTTLQSSYAPSSPTTGLTTERGAGEIEGEGGINRKNVWNEESLRLKDALGL